MKEKPVIHFRKLQGRIASVSGLSNQIALATGAMEEFRKLYFRRDCEIHQKRLEDELKGLVPNPDSVFPVDQGQWMYLACTEPAAYLPFVVLFSDQQQPLLSLVLFLEMSKKFEKTEVGALGASA
jgi:hypothetical protein